MAYTTHVFRPSRNNSLEPASNDHSNNLRLPGGVSRLSDGKQLGKRWHADHIIPLPGGVSRLSDGKMTTLFAPVAGARLPGGVSRLSDGKASEAALSHTKVLVLPGGVSRLSDGKNAVGGVMHVACVVAMRGIAPERLKVFWHKLDATSILGCHEGYRAGAIESLLKTLRRIGVDQSCHEGYRAGAIESLLHFSLMILSVLVAMRGIAPERLKEENAGSRGEERGQVAMRGIAPERLKVTRRILLALANLKLPGGVSRLSDGKNLGLYVTSYSSRLPGGVSRLSDGKWDSLTSFPVGPQGCHEGYRAGAIESMPFASIPPLAPVVAMRGIAPERLKVISNGSANLVQPLLPGGVSRLSDGK